MKKFNKIIVMVLMVALSIGSFFISPISAIVAATATVGAAFTLSKVPTTASINTPISIPKGKTNKSGAQVKVTVTDPAGKDVSSELQDNGDDYTLTPKMLGNYKVKYTSYGDSYYDVESNEYIIKVTGVKPTLSFESNVQEIIPSKLAYKEGRSIVLPVPTVTEKDSASDEDAEGKVLGQVVASEVSQTLKDGTMPLSDVEDLAGYTISAKDSRQNSITVGYTVKDIKIEKEDGSEVDGYEIHYTVSPVENVYGTYRITYKYQNVNGLSASKSMTFEVKKNYEEKTELSFKWKDGKSMPTTASAGDEVTLPTPAVTDATGSTVSTYTDVKVYYVPSGKLENSEEWKSLKVKDFKFTTSYKTTNGACYVVKYTITDFFGNKIEKQYSLDNVTDKINPKVYAVKDYSNDSDVVDIEDTMENMFPTYVAKGQSVNLPAIYAEDNISKVLNVEDNEKEITLTRRVVYNGSSSSFSSSSLITPKNAETNTFSDKNEVLFTPDKTGEYVIYYEATDKAGNSATSIKKTINVVETYADDLKPEITLPVLANVAYEGDTITFDAPTAKDYGMVDGEKKVVENDVEVLVDYYYVFANDTDNKDAADKQDLVVNKDGSYSLVVPTNKQVKKVVFVFSATDNGKYQNDSNLSNTQVEEVVVNIPQVSTDTDAPTTSTVFSEQSFGQVETKEIQSVTFTDENDLDISVKVDFAKESGERQSIAVFNGTTTSENNNYTLSGATFNSANVGDHYVTFTATDVNGNATIVSYKLTITATEKPEIEVAKSNSSTMEVGSEMNLSAGQLKYYGGNVVDGSIVKIRIVSGTTADAYITGNKLTAKTTGTVRYQYYAMYNTEEIVSSIKEITVQDTVAPTIEFFEGDLEADEWAGSTDHTMEVALEHLESSTGTLVKVNGEYVTYDANNTEHQSLTRYDKDKYANIQIPAVKVSDAYGIDEESVKVTSPSGKELLSSINKDKMISASPRYYYEFTPTGSGSYTITYSATDKAGKSTTMTYSLQVGDCESPVLELNNAQNITSTAKIGDILKIDLNVMNLSDNVDSSKTAVNALSASDGLKLSISIVTPDNQTISLTKDGDYYSSDDKTFTYTLSSAGEYTVKYVLTDNAGKEDEQSVKINVASTSSSNTTSDAVWGTILIVASVVLLGGVIVYFAVTNKKYTAKKKEDK